MNRLDLLFATDAVTYGNYLRSMLTMEAAAKATELKIDHAARVSRRMMKAKVKAIKKGGKKCSAILSI